MTTETPREVATLEPRLLERGQALVDILYLVQVTWLYVFSLVYPVVGLFFGILLLTASVSDKSRRIGRVCLILGIINTAVLVLAFVITLALGLTGSLASMFGGD